MSLHNLNGIINIYKEKGFTSHDVVAKLRGITKQKKIGHTGTLDPDAEGVLPVCMGNATKLCDMLTDKSKEYRAVLLLGKDTDTQDISGTLLNESLGWTFLSENEIKAVIDSFVGEYDQIPPMYSALKVNGKKLYELAREGKEIERAARKVSINYIKIVNITLPRVEMIVGCSKGTYIRTLCKDIGDKLKCYGCMESLLRTKVGAFTLDTAIKLKDAEMLMQNGQFENSLISPDAMFDYKMLFLKESGDKFVYNGNIFVKENVDVVLENNMENNSLDAKAIKENEYVKVYDSKKKFVGVYIKSKGLFRPVKMFL